MVFGKRWFISLMHVVTVASLQFPLGISAATCVRVGNALGAGNTARAIVTCKVALVLSGTKTRE